jgi:hypothetical protein
MGPNWSFQFFQFGSPQGHILFINGDNYPDLSQPIAVRATFTFTYGRSFDLEGSMAASASAYPTYPHTLNDYSATLVDFCLPSGASLSVASGTSYPVLDVPEPQSWLILFLGGAVAIFGLTWKRRS